MLESYNTLKICDAFDFNELFATDQNEFSTSFAMVRHTPCINFVCGLRLVCQAESWPKAEGNLLALLSFGSD